MSDVPKCERCGRKTQAIIGSMFDKKWICLDCKTKETRHPKYPEACQRDLEEVRKGNFNYEGIGVPSDLVNGCK